MNEYLDLAKRGKNEWWRVVLAVLVILGMWQVLGALPAAGLLVFSRITGRFTSLSASLLPGVEPILAFIFVMLASVAFVAGLVLAVCVIHRRPFRSLITPRKSYDARRLFLGFAVWFGLSGLGALVEALTHPGRYVWSFDPGSFFPFLILASIFIPIQSFAEEFFFRGYILQEAGLLFRNIWGLSALSGVLFMLPHLLNPEASTNFWMMGLYYFAMGAFLAYVTLRDGRLELALGMHAANNLFSSLVANTKVTVLPSPSLWTVGTLDVWFSVPVGLATITLALVLIYGLKRRNTPSVEAEEK